MRAMPMLSTQKAKSSSFLVLFNQQTPISPPVPVHSCLAHGRTFDPLAWPPFAANIVPVIDVKKRGDHSKAWMQQGNNDGGVGRRGISHKCRR